MNRFLMEFFFEYMIFFNGMVFFNRNEVSLLMERNNVQFFPFLLLLLLLLNNIIILLNFKKNMYIIYRNIWSKN